MIITFMSIAAGSSSRLFALQLLQTYTSNRNCLSERYSKRLNLLLPL
jgi:hypothetical protein